MLITIALATAGALAQALACRVAGDERRNQWLARHPGEAEDRDVVRLLRLDGLSTRDVRLVESLSRSRGMKPFARWSYAAAYGGRGLALAVAAGLSHDDLCEELAGDGVPDLDAYVVLAAHTGLACAQAPAGFAMPVAAVELTTFEVPSDEPVRDWDFDFEFTDRD